MAADEEMVNVNVGKDPPPVQLVFDKVSIEVPLPNKSTLKILNEVSGIFGPGETVAVMGPSGSGKTTMLNALTGVQPPTSGTITINNQPFSISAVKKVSAYVPQDDMLCPVLTVREALTEACIFKTKLGVAQREAKVSSLIQQFGLDVCKDVIIGSPTGKKGISGGQKRRVSVALELCGNPSLLYLDEPTSGLDAVSTLALVKLMRELAQGGMTVIATIHQPSANAFFTFDRLLLLVKGAICYYGPVSEEHQQPMAYLKDAGFACPPLNNPADFMFDVVVDDANAAKLVEKFLADGVAQDVERKPNPSLPKLSEDVTYESTFATQVLTHLARNKKILLRDPQMAKLRVGSNVGIGTVMGILYFGMKDDGDGINRRISLHLFLMLFTAIINAIPVVLQVFPELGVARKEARNNWYSPYSFVPAKLALDTPLLLLPPCLLVLVCGLLTGAVDSIGRYLLYITTLILIAASSHGVALCICGLAPSIDVAFLLAPASVMPMAIFSGFFQPQQEMTWIFRWITYIDYMNYGWQALSYAGFNGKVFNDTQINPRGFITTGPQVMSARLSLPSSSTEGYVTNLAILLGFVVLMRWTSMVLIARKFK